MSTNTEQALEQVKEELSRLNSQFEAQLKAAGVSEAELREMDLNNPPKELVSLLERAVAGAKRAGAERAGQAQTDAEAGAKTVPGKRPGALRL
jgi:hypothetical protein